MEKKSKKLILCIDIDNDLYEKAKVSGPLIGRKANLEGAIALSMADPEEPDANVIFIGVKLYDELSAKEEIEIVTLTGDKRLGVTADREVAEQLERILSQINAKSCIFISDGSSDEEIIPVIRSRLKIDAVRVVVMKQAKELEKTYFVLLEKLKDPYYSRILLGIPALILLLYSLASIFLIRMELVGILIAAYLLMKVTGLEANILNILGEFSFSVHRPSIIPAVGSIALFLLVAGISYDRFMHTGTILHGLRILFMFLPLPLFSLLVARVIDSIEHKNSLEIVKFGRYGVVLITMWAITVVSMDWLLNIRAGVGQVIETTILVIIVGTLGIVVLETVRFDIISKLKLENRDVVSLYGGYLGKVQGINRKNGMIVVQTPLGHILEVRLNDITNIREDRVLVNY